MVHCHFPLILLPSNTSLEEEDEVKEALIEKEQKVLKAFWGRTRINFSEKIQWKWKLICYCIGVSSDSGVFICYCSGETSGGAGFPLHGRSLKVLLHQQRGGRPKHISLKKKFHHHKSLPIREVAAPNIFCSANWDIFIIIRRYQFHCRCLNWWRWLDLNRANSTACRRG